MTIAEEINELYKSLKQELDRTPEGLLAELDYRCQWLARSSEILADCKLILDKRSGEEAEKFIGSEDGWNVVKILIASRVREEAKLVHLAERLNATICHQIDAVRSILSFEKESMRNSQWNSPSEERPSTS